MAILFAQKDAYTDKIWHLYVDICIFCLLFTPDDNVYCGRIVIAWQIKFWNDY